MEASVTDDTWDDLLKKSNEIPILVDFWAPWCGPCKTLNPILDWIRDQFVEKIYLTKLNVDDNQRTPLKYHVRTIPTLLLIHNEKVIRKDVGFKPKLVLKRMLDDYLKEIKEEETSNGFAIEAHKKALKAHNKPPKGD